MPIRTEVYVERNLMIHHFSEHISLPSILETMSFASTHPQYKPGMNMVWHCVTGTTIDLNADSSQAASDFARNIFDKNGQHYKAALVAVDDLPYGMLRSYEGWSNDRSSVDIQVFRELEEALVWVES